MSRDESATEGHDPAAMGRQAPAAIGFVGWSGSGKTTLIEALIPSLRRRGYRVGALKHDAHRFEIDVPGKDSYRLTAAGALSTLVVAADKLALVRHHDQAPSVESLLYDFFADCDIVLVEGYKRSRLPKIEVNRPALGKEALAAAAGHLDDLLAVATDDSEALNWAPRALPRLDLNEVEAVAEFIVERIIGPGHDPVAP